MFVCNVAIFTCIYLLIRFFCVDIQDLATATTKNYTWKQTLEEVTISIVLPAGTRGKDVVCKIDNKHLLVKVNATTVLDGELSQPVKASECTWSIEDRKLLVIVLQKLKRHDSWPSLIVGQQDVDAVTLEKMNKQMMLEKFQSENPGFDFSGAEFNGALPANPQTFMDDVRNK